ncbi:hypothetical protein ACHHYP_00666 [Achlya hypogyna]|uniref:FYVE-type domain-containing protein n=1 Tax=Achlya hypogyna TaxID=1202772 RepID=A0A1V9ZUM8_ACHHY|nr:hypothetical protein ACHHYP_00666 [Achlya hypogyna]
MNVPGLTPAAADSRRIQHEMAATVTTFMTRHEPAKREALAIDDGFKLVTSKGGARAFTRRADNSSFNELLVLDSLCMTLDEVIELKYAGTTDVFRVQMALFYADNFLDAAVMHTAQTATDTDPGQWFGIKYKKLLIPNSGFSDCRDVIYYEYMATTTDSAGHRTLLLMRDSSYLETYPTQPNSVRMFLRAIFVYTEIEPGRVESMHLAFMNPCGNMPAFLFNKQMLKYAGSCAKFPAFLQQKRLILLVQSQPVPRRRPDRHRCAVCDVKISGLKARYNCRACGDLMCAGCLVVVPRPVYSKLPPAVSKDDYCKRCFIGTARVRRSSLGSPHRPSMAPSTFAAQLAQSERPRRSKRLVDDSAVGTADDSAVGTLQRPDPFEQMQRALETQKQLVSQMQERLRAQP